MDSVLTKGGNIPWPHPRAELTVVGLPTGASVLAFLVTEARKVRTDGDFVFFNNPSVAGVAVAGHAATLELDQIPVRYRDGRTETVSTFGTVGGERDFRLATADGAVRQSRDVGRAESKGWRKKGPEVGQETVEINLNPDVLAVLRVVYSTQSNGVGSFRKYQVSMAIDNGNGDTVTIDASSASDDDLVFTCVPGIIRAHGCWSGQRVQVAQRRS